MNVEGKRGRGRPRKTLGAGEVIRADHRLNGLSRNSAAYGLESGELQSDNSG